MAYRDPDGNVGLAVDFAIAIKDEVSNRASQGAIPHSEVDHISGLAMDAYLSKKLRREIRWLKAEIEKQNRLVADANGLEIG